MNIVLFSFRGLGDAMIMTEMLNRYANDFSNFNITIITWSKNKSVFSKLTKNHKLLYVSGPLKNKYSNFILSCIKILKLVKKRHYDLAINFSGDFKENIYLSLVNSSRRISPFLARGHNQNNIITQPLVRHKNDIYIPAKIENIYKIYDYIFSLVFNLKPIDKISLEFSDAIKSIGLFPFAAQNCREWSLENWDLLGLYLLSKGYKVYYICLEEDKDLLSDFNSFNNGAQLFSDYSNDIFKVSEFIDFSICLDSFSSHLANFLRLPSITIFGSNNPALFLTNTSTPVSSDGGCVFYPCYNKPKCLNTEWQYACITSITVSNVVSVFEAKISLINE